jgi:hypothetical protein
MPNNCGVKKRAAACVAQVYMYPYKASSELSDLHVLVPTFLSVSSQCLGMRI